MKLMKGVNYVYIGLILSIIALSVALGRYIIINIRRLRSHNVFSESDFITVLPVVLILYVIIKSISNIIISGDHTIGAYFQILIYSIPIWIYLKWGRHQTIVSIENVYKSELESILDLVFKEKDLALIKEETDDEKTIFSFEDPSIKSKLVINTSLSSTKRHTLIIDNKKDLPYIKEILEGIDLKIPAIPKKSILIKFTIKILIIGYITWKFLGLFKYKS